MFASADEGALSLDVDGRIIDANDRLAGLLLYRPEELAGRSLLDLGSVQPTPERGRGLALDRLARQGYLRNDDLPLATRDGRCVYFDFQQVGLLEGGVRLIRCSPRSGRMDLADIGDGRDSASSRVLVSLEALHDATRRELHRNQRSRRALSLLSIGIDRYGSADAAEARGWARLVSALLRVAAEALRETDRLAPAGDGVLLALLPDVDAKGALRAAERLRTAIANSNLRLPGDEERHATVSVGVATTRAGRASCEVLRARAEANRRMARRSGGNRVTG